MSGPEPLDRLLDALAREDAAAVLAEAREAARDRVRERLTDELARQMLDRVAAERAAGPRAEPGAEVEPPPAVDGTGVYVYAVVDDGAGVATDGLHGVADAAVRIVAADDGALHALVSDVPLGEFGDEALKRNLNELPWLSATAVAHERVVEAALAAATVVPMRLCTIFRDDRGVRDMLAREAAGLGAALARLRGSQEWGVKAIADPGALADAIGEHSERVRDLRRGVAAGGEGAGYFASLKLEQATREELAAQLETRAREIHDAVAALATDARLHPPTSRELGGYEGEMVLNGAYLVPVEQTDALRERVASLAERHGRDGLKVELTGPWPPYNFSMLAGAL
jgi:Gas vesicle synthesis protein GvpL/GvpF